MPVGSARGPARRGPQQALGRLTIAPRTLSLNTETERVEREAADLDDG
jgi:hypothetical protein